MTDPECYAPYLDEYGRVQEPSDDYVRRMQDSVLPRWPEELLREWLHRHHGFLYHYVHLGFETFSFSRETWSLDRVPGREAFREEEFCDNFSDVALRAENPHDWLAHYMLQHGTWNTPIVLLSNEHGQHRDQYGEPLRRPLHLLEGHRRLSFLVGLRRLGRALPQHEVWLVRITGS